MMAMHRLQDGPSGAHKTEQNRMKDELAEYKREAEQVSRVSVVTASGIVGDLITEDDSRYFPQEDVDQVLDEGNKGPEKR